MGISTLDPAKSRELCAEVAPKVIENDREFDHLVELMEELDFQENPTPEEEALAATLAVLIPDDDDKHHRLPRTSPDRMIRLLMEPRLRQADLLPIFVTRSVASDVITGKHEPSKAQVRKLAEFFRVPAELFLSGEFATSEFYL
jgi:HTH-type transcriptional regulator / antitoxin HigA